MQTCCRASAKGVVVQLRPMTTADLDAVLSIEERVHSHPWSRGNFADSLAVGNDCWLAEIQGQPAGYVIAKAAGGEAELLNISVAPDRQGNGVGRVLLDFIIAAVQPRAELLFLEVRPSNHSAIGLYQSHGFNEVGVRPGYYPSAGGREDALIFARVLGPVNSS